MVATRWFVNGKEVEAVAGSGWQPVLLPLLSVLLLVVWTQS